MAVTSDDAVLTSLLLLSAAASAAADDSAAPIPPPQLGFFYPSMGSVFFAFLFTIFFICFFSVYLRLRYNASGANRLLPGASIRLRSLATGLDAAVIESFPVLLYSEVEEHKICKGALECAICLNEFQEDETLRLIPKCDHVFHPECIDAWLASHVTCPVCRANLFPEPDKITHTGSSQPEPGNPEGADTISVRVVPQESIDSIPAAQDQVLGRQIRLLGKFPKSHSTGHSLVQLGERIERFTLRLPDHVRSEVITRALTRAATFNIREGSSRRGKRSSVGEGSSRGVRLYKQLDRRFKSDRWAITVPFWSQGRVSAGDGEGSTGRGIRTSVKLPSVSCLGPAASGDGSGSVNPGSVRAEV